MNAPVANHLARVTTAYRGVESGEVEHRVQRNTAFGFPPLSQLLEVIRSPTFDARGEECARRVVARDELGHVREAERRDGGASVHRGAIPELASVVAAPAANGSILQKGADVIGATDQLFCGRD
jgi:hypothetical protein